MSVPVGARPAGGWLRRWMPAASWLPSYDRTWLRPDLIAGLTLWGLLVPEGMAYAGIAGLPAEAGLYTLVASLLVYALFGTSRHLSVGPTSASAALLAAAVAGVATLEGESTVAVASALVLVVAGLFLVAGIARLGFITQFLSKPVMDGFVVGLAVFVAVGQMHKLFGVSKGDGNTLRKLGHVLVEIPSANVATVLVAASALVVLFGLPRISPRLPSGLVVLFGAIAVSSALDLSGTHDVDVAGTLPQGLPSLGFPDLPVSTWGALVLSAVGIVVVAYSEALGVAREFAEKNGYEVDPNQELRAHGLTNAVSGLLGGMVAAGGMSGSAVKAGAGARSQVANLVAWGATIVTVIALTPLFKTLPEAVLGALIIHALWHILVARKLKAIRAVSRTEFWLAVLTFAGVVLWDVLAGMVLGLLASLVLFLYRTSRPHVATLGRLRDVPGAYGDLDRHSDAEPVPGVLIVRLDAPLFYANALTFRDRVNELLATRTVRPRAVILDASLQDDLDITSAEMLASLVSSLRAEGIDVLAANVHEPVRAFARRTGLLAGLGEDRVFRTLDAAVRAVDAGAGPTS